ncbi:MAG: hypothetical protein ACXVXT_09780 [Blastococcus sp.]
MDTTHARTRGPTFRADVRGELGRLLRWPSDDLLTIVVNALLVCGGWLLLPPAAKAWLFTLQGPLAFAVVLSAWMLSDTPSTNMLGNDAGRALDALPEPPRLRRLLRAKAAALGCVIGPVSAVVCIAIAAYDGNVAAGLAVALVLLVLPLGVAAIAPWLGAVWPYHPRRLAWRRAHRRPWRRTLRWGTVVVAPYGVVPLIALALLAPGILAGLAIGERGANGYLSGWSLAVPVAVTCLLAGAAFWAGPLVTTRLVARREPAVSDYLRDPDRG